ncbi:MAG: hypothetical protein V1728_04465 [Candidatus Micrarchaeota archaeon]
MERKTMVAPGLLALVGAIPIAMAYAGSGQDTFAPGFGMMGGGSVNMIGFGWPGTGTQDAGGGWEAMRRMHNPMHGTDYPAEQFANLHAAGMAQYGPGDGGFGCH